MDWIKKHVDTVIILGGIVSSVLWMNAEFNKIKTDLAVIKAVLMMKGIMTPEMIAKYHEQKE